MGKEVRNKKKKERKFTQIFGGKIPMNFHNLSTSLLKHR